MTGRDLAVIKVGGSLLDWPELPGRLIGLSRHAASSQTTVNDAVLIAGGGAAADWIRCLDQIHGLGDVAADRLAVHALDLTAAILAELLPGSIMVDRLEMLEAARRNIDRSRSWHRDRVWQRSNECGAAPFLQAGTSHPTRSPRGSPRTLKPGLSSC